MLASMGGCKEFHIVHSFSRVLRHAGIMLGLFFQGYHIYTRTNVSLHGKAVGLQFFRGESPGRWKVTRRLLNEATRCSDRMRDNASHIRSVLISTRLISLFHASP